MPSLSKWVWAFFIALVCASGCASGCAKRTSNAAETTLAGRPEGTNKPPPPTESTEPDQDESSVHPGINDPYFRPDGPERYRRILEAESREIVQRRSDIVDAIGLRTGMVVADIGAGTGLLTTEIAQRVGTRGQVYAVDIVPEFLDLIRSRAAEQGLRNVTVIQGEEKAAGLGPGSIDLAFMCDTYHHLEFPHAYMRSVFVSLRPGATLVLVDMKRVEGESSPGVLAVRESCGTSAPAKPRSSGRSSERASSSGPKPSFSRRTITCTSGVLEPKHRRNWVRPACFRCILWRNYAHAA